MNWIRIVVAGVVGGIVINLADFIMHGFILGATYMRYDVFTKEQGNPLHFFAIAISSAILLTVLYAKTVDSWSGGWKGGATFGFFAGLAAFFINHYYPIVLDGFPYYLAWCWGGVRLISWVIGGAVIGAVYKPKE